MKIMVLEHPRLPSDAHFNDIANTPLWSCLMGGYVTAQLMREGHDVSYRDAVLSGWDFDRTGEEIFKNRWSCCASMPFTSGKKTHRLFDFIKGVKVFLNRYAGGIPKPLLLDKGHNGFQK